MEYPSLVLKYSKVQIILVLVSYFFGSYLLAGYFYFGTAFEIPKVLIDDFIGFKPNFIFLYFSSYVYPLTIFFYGKDKINMDKFLYTFIVLVAISTLIFFFIPTTIPRMNYVVDENLGFFTRESMKLIRLLDVSNNCLPSLHVSSAVLISLFYLHENRKLFFISGVWSLGIIYSTMATKQHYFWDCLGGFVVAILVYFLIYKRIRVRS